MNALRKSFKEHGNYDKYNSLVIKVEFKSDRINVWCKPPGDSKTAIVRLPIRTDVVEALFKITETDDLSKVEGKPVRLLRLFKTYHITHWDITHWDGICHFMRDDHMSCLDLWKDNDRPELGPNPLCLKGVDIFENAGAPHPPGLKWRLENSGDRKFKLWCSDRKMVLADNVEWELAKWMEKVGLGRRDDDIPI